MFYKFEVLDTDGVVHCRRPAESRDEAKRDGLQELKARLAGTGVLRLIECEYVQRWLTDIYAYNDGKEVVHRRGRKAIQLDRNGM